MAERLPLRRRLLYSLFVAVLVLVLMEGVLQFASRVVQGRAVRDAALDAGAAREPIDAAVAGNEGAPKQRITILCVGDSHTYGLPLPEEESYPAQLEVALAKAHPRYEFRVVNLGIPSVNSAFVANRLERQLFQIRPQLVIVWAGINNIWNAVESDRWSDDDRWRALRRQLMRSKLFRLVSIAWFNAIGHQYDTDERGGWYEGEAPPSGLLAEDLDMPDPAPGLAEDMARMTALTHAVDTPILFVAYPFGGQQPISRVIRATASRLGVGVIDAALALQRAQRDGHTNAELIDERAGPHPSGLLYRYVVEAMVPEVVGTLQAWGGVGFVGNPHSANHAGTM